MKRITTIILVTLLVVLAGCKQAETTPEPIEGQEVMVDFPSLIIEPEQQTKSVPREYVEKRTFGKSGVMTVSGSITEGAAASSNDTKASVHPEFTNVWVLQFASDGTVLQCNNIGLVTADQAVKAKLTAANNTTIYVLANGSAVELEKKATSEAAFLAATYDTPASGVTTLWGKQTGIDVVMIGGTAVMMSPGGELRTIGMQPNAAKVNVELDITGIQGMSFASVGLCNVPQTAPFVSDLNKTTSAGYQEDWGEKSAAPYSWSVPQNRQGEVTGITSSSQRNHDKSPKDATYARVTLSDEISIAFDVFLGNGLKNFDVTSNCTYNLKITIAGTLADFKLMAASDDRVIIGGPLDYTKTPANTYIAYSKAVGGKVQNIMFDATKKPQSAMTGKEGTIAHQGYMSGTESGTSNYYMDGVYPRLAPDVTVSEQPLTTNLAITDISYVQVVWQTMKDHGKGIDTYGGTTNFKDYNAVTQGTAFINLITYDKTTGYVTVKTNGTGNALVAAYDSDNNILWSWQIWGTETKPQANVTPMNAAANGTGKKFMDRNLGALAATTVKPSVEDAYKYFGTFYEWGRKEPFTSTGPQYTTSLGYDVNSIPTAIFNKDGQWMLSSYDDPDLTKPENNTIGGFEPKTSAASSTYAFLKTPTTYYKERDDGNVVDNPNTWTPYSIGVTKSIYDPCPYGYRVATNGSWDGWTSCKAWTHYAIDAGAVWQDSWWPTPGGREGDATLYYFGLHSWYWSASSDPDSSGLALCMGIGPNENINPTLGNGRCFGVPVRCVEE